MHISKDDKQDALEGYQQYSTLTADELRLFYEDLSLPTRISRKRKGSR
jgi:hypothetical protein